MKENHNEPLESLLNTIRTDHECGRWEEARAGYEKLLTRAPGNAIAHHLAGVLRFQLGDPESALALLQKAVELEPGNAGFWSNLGNVHLSLGRDEEAVKAYLRALDRDDSDPAIHNNLGLAFLHRRDPERAERCFRTAISLDSTAADYFFNLGNVLGLREKFSEAADAFQVAISLDPDREGPRVGMAKAYFALQHWDDAEAAYRSALELVPDSAPARLGLARTLVARGNLLEAERLLRTVQGAGPADGRESGHSGAERLLGDEAWLSKSPDRGEGVASSGASSRADTLTRTPVPPCSAEIHYELGRIYEAMNNPAGAAEAYRRSLDLRPEDAVSWNLLGNSLLRLGESSRAADVYRKAHSLAPGEAGILSNLGMALSLAGMSGEGVACLRKAESMAPDQAPLGFNLAHVLAADGRPDEAILQYQHVIEADPEFGPAYIDLARVLKRLGRKEEAVEAIRRASAIDPEKYGRDHLLASEFGTTTETAPRGYIVGLFDGYSARYEAHLVGSLQYRAPVLVRKALLRAVHPGRRFCNALDLGCGTGLMGAAIRDLVDRLTGIDLSLKMAEKASEKNTYDAIQIGDLCDFLNGTGEKYDLFVSADVLVYIGNLRPLFAGIRRCMAPGGYVVFSTERDEGDSDYVLNTTGRYAHTCRYLESLAAEHRFRVLHMGSAEIRRENSRPVSGTITILEDDR
jgi:predicted TPR repeat methyltransferase